PSSPYLFVCIVLDRLTWSLRPSGRAQGDV
ncbi:MAG: hypothetical protein ACI8RZ_001850, partial [Myxococcota bacterium]